MICNTEKYVDILYQIAKLFSCFPGPSPGKAGVKRKSGEIEREEQDDDVDHGNFCYTMN